VIGSLPFFNNSIVKFGMEHIVFTVVCVLPYFLHHIFHNWPVIIINPLYGVLWVLVMVSEEPTTGVNTIVCDMATCL
jgi:hypothetical protein